MKLRIILAIAIFALAGTALNATTADEVIKKSIKAVGMEDNAPKTMHMTGTMSMPMLEKPAKFELWFKEPEMIKTDIVMFMPTGQEMAMSQAFDGEKGWMINPMTGSTEPQEVPEAQLEQIKQQKNTVGGPFSDYEKGDYEVELMGEKNVAGKTAYKIKMVDKDENISFIYVDKESYLPLKIEQNQQQMGQTIFVETYMKDFKKVGGVMIAHKVEAQADGVTQMTLEIQTAEANVDIDDSVFKM